MERKRGDLLAIGDEQLVYKLDSNDFPLFFSLLFRTLLDGSEGITHRAWILDRRGWSDRGKWTTTKRENRSRPLICTVRHPRSSLLLPPFTPLSPQTHPSRPSSARVRRAGMHTYRVRTSAGWESNGIVRGYTLIDVTYTRLMTSRRHHHRPARSNTNDATSRYQRIHIFERSLPDGSRFILGTRREKEGGYRHLFHSDLQKHVLHASVEA